MKLSDPVGLIGAGPVGLEMAVAMKRAGINYVHFDAGQIGQTISWFPAGTRFFSSNERIAIAGVPLSTTNQEKASREEYLAYLRAVVTQFGLEVRSYERVSAIDRDGDGFLIRSQRAGRPAKATRVGKVILSTGGTDRPRKLNIPGEDLPHVSHYFHDPHPYFGQRLLIVGGKNSAVEAALRCHHAGAHVAMSYRREKLPERSIKYWLMPEITSLLRGQRIASYFETVPIAIDASTVTLRRGDETFTVPADFVLLLIGYEQDHALLKQAGVELKDECESPTFDAQTMETNVPGVYVAGTATGGTQVRYSVFIENCHVHVERILAALTGRSADVRPAVYDAPES